jgi:hypothetical protein
MNIKVIQIDDRKSNLYFQSKDLIAGRNHMNAYGNSWHNVDRAAMNKEELSNPWKFWDFSRTINAVQCKRMTSQIQNSNENYLFNKIEYEWISIDADFMKGEQYDKIWLKIKFLKEYLKQFDSNQIIIFIDSDAIIRDRNKLIDLLNKFINSSKDLYISLDVPRPRNSKVNDGFMIIRCGDVMTQYFNDIWNNVDLMPEMRWKFPHMQKIADLILEKNEYKDNVMYASCTTETNTPIGEIIRHIWYKEMIPEIMLDQAFSLLAEEI